MAWLRFESGRWPRLAGTDGRFRRLERAVEIAAPRHLVFDWWTRYETLPHILDSVRRTKCVNGAHVLWDVEIAGRQLVWEAEFVERVGRSVRWESVWGARNRGEVRFRELDEGRTRLEIELEYRPKGWLERLGARLGLVDACVVHDLARFRRFAEKRAQVGDELRGYEDDREELRVHKAS